MDISRTMTPYPSSMTSPSARPADSTDGSTDNSTGNSPEHSGSPAARLQFDDPLSLHSADDSDSGWGERPASGDGTGSGSAADLARFLDEKPPHHL